MPDEGEPSTRDQRNLRNNVTTLTDELVGLTTTINAQRNEINQNFRTLEDRLQQVEAPQMLNLTGGRSTDSLPTYDGESDFDDWLSLFNRVKEAYSWNEARALKILPAYLRGNAADLYNELTDNQKATLGDLINGMRAALEPEEMARITQSKLIKRRMQPFESVIDFASSIQRLVKSAYRRLPVDAQDTLMRNHFIERIRPEIKRFLLLMDPKDYQTAKRKAMQIESHNVEMDGDEEVSNERKKGEKKQRILMAQDESQEMKNLLTEILNEMKQKDYRIQQSPVFQNIPRNSPNYQGYRTSSFNRRRDFQNTPRSTRMSWNRPRQSSWGPNRAYGPPLRYQGSPSGRLICYKCGRYDHTSVVCPQNRGRTLGGPQPFWRSQNAVPPQINYGPTRETGSIPINGAVNGLQSAVVYQYLPTTPSSEQQQGPHMPHGHVCLEVRPENQINVLVADGKSKEEKQDETKVAGNASVYTRETITDQGIRKKCLNPSTSANHQIKLEKEHANSLQIKQMNEQMLPSANQARKESNLSQEDAQVRCYPLDHSCNYQLNRKRGNHGRRPYITWKSDTTNSKENTCHIKAQLKKSRSEMDILQDIQTKPLVPPQETETLDMRCQRLLQNFSVYPPIESLVPTTGLSTYHQNEIWQQSPQYGIYWNERDTQRGDHNNSRLSNEVMEAESPVHHDRITHSCSMGQLICQHHKDHNMRNVVISGKTYTDLENIPVNLLADMENETTMEEEPRMGAKWSKPLQLTEDKAEQGLHTIMGNTKHNSTPEIFTINDKEMSVSTSVAYSSNYFPGWGSWPDVSLEVPPPMRALAIKKWKSCSSLFLHAIGVMMICCLMINYIDCEKPLDIAPQPMLCQTSKPGTMWRLPILPKCHVGTRSFSAQLYEETMRLYKRNLIKYESNAYHCRIVHHEVETFTYLFVNRRLKKEKTVERNVGIEECKRMQRFKKCEHGSLNLVDGMWQTSNTLNWDYPGGFFQCCTWVKYKATNCFLLKTKVYKAHSDKTMDGLISGVSHCNYQQGGCSLQDGSALIWQPNSQEKCEYIKWKVLKGEALGNSWLTLDHNFALTKTKKIIRVCGSTVFMSVQGIAFRVQKRSVQNRKKRQAFKNETGLVTTDQLSSQLQALEIITRRNINFAFRHASMASCHNLNSLLTYLTHLMMAEPTAAVRALLNKTTITARAGFNIIEVFPCAELNQNSYEFHAMNNTCTKDIPMTFQAGENKIKGYMDIRTNIIHESSTMEDCSHV
ncbi:MAG: hypothetical protein GY816_11165, partial [Cytophagales bacterium]|nr:hypothetical protein [Cytophagales bacterium]